MHVINRLLFTGFVICVLMCACTGNKQGNAFTTSLVEKQIDSTGYYISLPAGYSITTKGGPDFSVYYFATIDTTDKKSFSGGLYIGGYPNRFTPPDSSCTTSMITNNILGKAAEWTVYKCDSNYTVQTLVNNTGGDANEKIHAFGDARSETDMQKLFDIYATLRQKK